MQEAESHLGPYHLYRERNHLSVSRFDLGVLKTGAIVGEQFCVKQM